MIWQKQDHPALLHHHRADHPRSIAAPDPAALEHWERRHWSRDTRLGEEAHRYADRIGAPVFSFLRTVVMNLLRRAGYRSIRQGLRELAYDIHGMVALGGVQLAKNGTWINFQASLHLE
jgi:hypothetical protein